MNERDLFVTKQLSRPDLSGHFSDPKMIIHYVAQIVEHGSPGMVVLEHAFKYLSNTKMA